jgi:hypothetical protein
MIIYLCELQYSVVRGIYIMQYSDVLYNAVFILLVSVIFVLLYRAALIWTAYRCTVK